MPRATLIARLWLSCTSHLDTVMARGQGGPGVTEGGIFRQGKISGGYFVFQICAESPPEIFCAIPAMSGSLGRQLTFFFCRKVLVRVYCVSGLVCMPVQNVFFVYPLCTPRTVFPAPVTIFEDGRSSMPRNLGRVCPGDSHQFLRDLGGPHPRN